MVFLFHIDGPKCGFVGTAGRDAFDCRLGGEHGVILIVVAVHAVAPDGVEVGKGIQPVAHPAYFGSYAGIGQVRQYLDGFANLFPVGRNGMHRYNNQDHSMLAAKAAVDAIVAGSADKTSLWSVNVEDEYHEQVQQPRTIAEQAA